MIKTAPEHISKYHLISGEDAVDPASSRPKGLHDFGASPEVDSSPFDESRIRN